MARAGDTGDLREVRALAYVGLYRFDLFSDFTLFARDPIDGDEIEQVDRRTFFGGRASLRIAREALGARFDTRVGVDARGDDVHAELWDTRARVRRARRGDDGVREEALGAWAASEITPARWLRASVGARADRLAFAVDDRSRDGASPRSVAGAAHPIGPKASVVVTPIARPAAVVDLYADYGHGFHTNDVRGALGPRPVTPIARAVGEEIGARVRLFDAWELGAALWSLDLASETVWNGDEGTTAPSDPTHRDGVELDARVALTRWLAADANVAFTHAAFTVDHGNGGAVALAPKQTWAGGLSARHPSGARGGLRVHGIGDRPASEDGALVARGFTQVDLRLGYRARRFDVTFDVENLLNGAFRAAQFDTVSRLPSEPAMGAPIPPGLTCGRGGRVVRDARGGFAGCEDVSFTPAYPLTARAMLTLFLD